MSIVPLFIIGGGNFSPDFTHKQRFMFGAKIKVTRPLSIVSRQTICTPTKTLLGT